MLNMTFTQKHGGGVASWRVFRLHRDAGYYECVCTGGTGSHVFTGQIQTFSRAKIALLAAQ